MGKLTKMGARLLNSHGSKILIAASIASTISAVIFASKSKAKYDLLIEEMKEDKGEELKKTEYVRPIIKAYWPSILLIVLSSACVIGSHLLDKKKQAVLAAALTTSNAALNEFQKKAIEKIGEKKVTEIKDSIKKEHIDSKPIDPNKIIVTGSKNKVLMFDDYSGRYFESDIETIRRAVNTVNRRIPDETYVTLNDLYAEIGIPSITMGDEIGWHMDYDGGKFEERISAQVTESGEPCIVISYEPHPNVVGYFRD